MASMKKVKVELGPRSYDIRIGTGLLSRLGLWLKERDLSGKAVVITDTTVKGLYGEAVNEALANAGFDATVLEVPPGEEQKTLATAARLYGELTGAYAERSTPIIALGGGVIGDLAGFVAATYMRGVPLVQVPTTLLAQVDSSIGGKTAVDHGEMKNMIGAFYQPQLVVADIDTLQTLPEDELASGMAEVIKGAAIRNRNLFNYLNINMKKVRELHPVVLEDIVLETARIKADIVAQDEKESGLREILNYGHTVGHAIESVSGFKIKHGQAVAVGMIAAGRISCLMDLLSESDVSRLEEVIISAGLPTRMSGFKREEIMLALRHDKKVLHDRVRFILLKSIGNAFVTDKVDLDLLEEVISGLG
jgi:3-dehydroquinate synthase